MAVRLRLTRRGKKKQPTYRVVAADSRSPRDGRFIEIIGFYDPRQEPSEIRIDNDKAVKWLRVGAQPSERVRKLLDISGAWAEFKGEPLPAAATKAAGAEAPRVVTRARGDEEDAEAEAAEEVAAEKEAVEKEAVASDEKATAKSDAEAEDPEAEDGEDTEAAEAELAEAEDEAEAEAEDGAEAEVAEAELAEAAAEEAESEAAEVKTEAAEAETAEETEEDKQ